jgi:hypothetical protein
VLTRSSPGILWIRQEERQRGLRERESLGRSEGRRMGSRKCEDRGGQQFWGERFLSVPCRFVGRHHTRGRRKSSAAVEIREGALARTGTSSPPALESPRIVARRSLGGRPVNGPTNGGSSPTLLDPCPIASRTSTESGMVRAFLPHRWQEVGYRGPLARQVPVLWPPYRPMPLRDPKFCRCGMHSNVPGNAFPCSNTLVLGMSCRVTGRRESNRTQTTAFYTV